MTRLDGQVALITGGAAGLGKVIAQRLAKDGARVVISDVDRIAGERSATECGFMFLEQDVCDEARWSEVIRTVEAHYGTFTILVNNAGIVGSADTMSPENTRLADWRRVFAVNVEGPFLACQAVIPAMRRARGGSIVNMGSTAGLRASPYATAYGASKAAVRHLTKTVAQYCAQLRLNIRCNAVCPGVVRTPLWEQFATEQARARGLTIEDIAVETLATIPLGEFICPEDVAAAVSFLVSADARQITGAELMVDGGVVHCDTYPLHLTESNRAPGVVPNPSKQR